MKVLKLGTTDYGCLEPGESPYVEFPNRGLAISLLNRLRVEPGGMVTLRGLLRDAGGTIMPSEIARLCDEAVLTHLADMLVSRRLKLMRLPEESPAPAEAAPAQEEAAPSPPPLRPAKEEVEEPPAAAEEEDTHWIELVVLEAEGDQPMQGVTATLKLPTGDDEELVTDEQGKIRKEQLPSGSWEIKELESEAVLEVVEVS